MRQRILSGVLALLVIVLVGAAGAQTYDLSKHLTLTPGQWLMEESRQLNNPQAPVQKIGIIVTQQGPYILQNEFDWNGQTWVPTDVNVWKVTTTHIEYLGWYDPVSLQYGLMAQPLRIPRYMKLNEPVCVKGKMTSGAQSMPMSLHLVITQVGITKKVKSGTYTNCIRLKITVVTNDTTKVSSEVLAPGHGRVYSVETELDETEPVAYMLEGEVYERTDPKKP
jgi:hypothetical protein